MKPHSGKVMVGDVKGDVIKHINTIPGFNATVSKVIQLSRDPNSQAKDLIHTISIDPSLTTEILKLINSAYFGLTGKVFSLNRAVVMLGMNTVKNVAISTSLISSIKLRDDFPWYTSGEFWEHSLGCAVAAKLIAEYTGVRMQEREEYFIAGLLHDIGKVVFIQHYADPFAKIVDPGYRKGTSRCRLEGEEFGLDHTELGNLMIKKWNLPEALAETIKNHHGPIIPGENYDKITAAVHLADFICNARGIGITNCVDEDPLDSRAYTVLEVDKKEADELFANLKEKVAEAKIFLKQ